MIIIELITSLSVINAIAINIYEIVKQNLIRNIVYIIRYYSK